MNHLATTDNNLGVSLSALACANENAAEVYKDLSNVANLPLKELCAKNPSLIVFPKILGQAHDGIEEEKIFEMSGNFENPQDAKITTRNLMGFLGVGNTQLKISSRFTKDDKQDFFLYYMLQKIFSINLFDYKYTSSLNGALDLLLFLFPHFLKKALAQGMYRQYQTFEKNDANVKGVIDVNRHIRQNIPFAGRIAYNSRERSFDNSITQLIRHTIETIKTTPFGNMLLTRDTEVKKCIQEIVVATESYTVRNREKVIARNLKPISHPYYTAYKPLQKLCVAILQHKKNGYGNSKNKVYGILFDGAWLWEEYLATILTSCGFSHPKNKSGTGGISVYNGNPRYPDFYFGKQIPKNSNHKVLEQAANENFVLDAKYKHLDNHISNSDEIKGCFSRDDLHQLITYMYIMPANRAGLIYPYDKADKRDEAKIIESKPKDLFGYGGKIRTYGMPIPVTRTYAEFQHSMCEIENKLVYMMKNTKCQD